MKQAVIDIGSNSMRLTLYEVSGDAFRILFKEKKMAGLAGYVKNGKLSREGIQCAIIGLLEFKETLRSLGIENCVVFATASLRNIVNSKDAADKISKASGFEVEILSGRDEALFGYLGAMREIQIGNGAFLDIGGASTEIVVFEDEHATESISLHLGSLSLYSQCVKKIIPGAGSQKRLQKVIEEVMDDADEFQFEKEKMLLCVGGTARAVLKLAKKYFALEEECTKVTTGQLRELTAFLCSGRKAATDLILKQEADRIHTMIPGLMILCAIVEKFQAEEIIVSRYGVREGYLCQRLINNPNSVIHKTEN